MFVQVADVLSEQARFGIHLLPATIDTCFKQVSFGGYYSCLCWDCLSEILNLEADKTLENSK